MARVTVEDCLENVDNRFQLVLVAAKRARDLSVGHQATLDWENDKPTVLALREIATGAVDSSYLERKTTEQAESEQEQHEEAAPGGSEQPTV